MDDRAMSVLEGRVDEAPSTNNSVEVRFESALSDGLSQEQQMLYLSPGISLFKAPTCFHGLYSTSPRQRRPGRGRRSSLRRRKT